MTAIPPLTLNQNGGVINPQWRVVWPDNWSGFKRHICTGIATKLPRAVCFIWTEALDIRAQPKKQRHPKLISSTLWTDRPQRSLWFTISFGTFRNSKTLIIRIWICICLTDWS